LADFFAGAAGAVTFFEGDLAGALTGDFATTFLAGALTAAFFTGTEFFFTAAGLATGFAATFLAALTGAAFLAETLMAADLFAGVFLAGASLLFATNASFNANLQCSC